MAVHQEPSSAEAVHRFLEAQDLALLDKPLVFERTDQWNTYQCCLGLSGCVCTLGVSALWCPVGTFCPAVIFKQHNLQVGVASGARQTRRLRRFSAAHMCRGGGVDAILLFSGVTLQQTCTRLHSVAHRDQSPPSHTQTPSCCTHCPTRPASAALQLDKDAVQLNSASNDCCCHIASSVKTVPLEKIQDVELSKDWVQSIFGLQMVSSSSLSCMHGKGAGRGGGRSCL